MPELLEPRRLPAGTTLAAVIAAPESGPNDTVDAAQDLGSVLDSRPVRVLGTIGGEASGAADVDWYRFTLDRPELVRVTAAGPAGSPAFHPIVGLYGNDPFNFLDPADANGYRLLEQAGGPTDPGPGIERALGPGTYDVAISGAGNRDFHPLLAGSGLPGELGDYELGISSTAIAMEPGDGPRVLVADPAPGSLLNGSPLVLRFDISAGLDPDTIIPGQTVRLISNVDGHFGGDGDREVQLGAVNFSVTASELQLIPTAALAPGYYRVVLAGDSGAPDATAVLTDTSAVPLGTTPDHPNGQDAVIPFRVVGSEGGSGTADDTPATSLDLGDLSASGSARAVGAIGDDPFFDPGRSQDPGDPDPALNPANDVDMYHFRVTGPGRYAFAAEVMAGRIGSTLDPGMSLYKLGPDGHTLIFVSGGNDTLNPATATDGSTPLLTDAALYTGLTSGDYYLAVADGINTPSPLENQAPGSPGLLDPDISHSARLGTSTGTYVLMLGIHPTPEPPHVVGTDPVEGQALGESPTKLTLRFDAPVNLQLLAHAAYLQAELAPAQAVYIQGEDGARYYPRLSGYDQDGYRAEFLMLQRLADGDYTLHVSGASGLEDLGGNPLVGNDPGGDFVVHFRVAAPELGLIGDTVGGYRFASRLDDSGLQDLGVLFPSELQAGVHVIGASEPGGVSAAPPEYRFELLQDRSYFFSCDGPELRDGVRLVLTDDQGDEIVLSRNDGAGSAIFGQVAPGVYRLRIEGLTPGLAYRVSLSASTTSDNPPPLLTGPAPALAIRFPTVVAPPPSPGGSGTSPVVAAGGSAPGVSPGSDPVSSPVESGGSPVPPSTSTGGASSGSVPASSAPGPGPGGQPGLTSNTSFGPQSLAASGGFTSGVGGSGSIGAVGGAAVLSGDSGASTHREDTGPGSAPGLSPGSLLVFGVGPVGGTSGPGHGGDLALSLTLNLPATGGAGPAGTSSLAAILHIGTSGLAAVAHPASRVPEEGIAAEEPGTTSAIEAESDPRLEPPRDAFPAADGSSTSWPPDDDHLSTALVTVDAGGPSHAEDDAANWISEVAGPRVTLAGGMLPPVRDEAQTPLAAGPIRLVAFGAVAVVVATSRRVRRLVGRLLRRGPGRPTVARPGVREPASSRRDPMSGLSRPHRHIPARDQPTEAYCGRFAPLERVG